MGKRHARHVFMPGVYVFPGGRTDPHDARVPVQSALDPRDAARLVAPGREGRARAIALSALREAAEEAGLFLGQRCDFSTRAAGWGDFATLGVAPSLEPLRLVARAITPPGPPRRFDTRFFAVFRDAVAHEAPHLASGELEDLVWPTLDETRELPLSSITGGILADLRERMAADPELTPGWPVPFYRQRHGRHVRSLI